MPDKYNYKRDRFGHYAPKYTSVEEMQKKIDEYFEYCKGRVLDDPDGNPVLNKWGDPVIVDNHPPTVTGLAYFLGFRSRVALLNYQNRRKDFNEIIAYAKLRIESYAEERLYDKEGSNGARFSLERNFKWAPEEKEQTGPAITIINDLPKQAPRLDTNTAVFNPLLNLKDGDAVDAEPVE